MNAVLCSSKGQNGGMCCLAVQHRAAAAFRAPREGWKQPRGRRVLSCSWSGTFFSPELHNPKWNVHLPLFLLFNACRRLGVCYCAVPTQ